MTHRGLRIAALLACLASPNLAQATPPTGRVWLYGNFTALLTPGLSLTVMPGARYEVQRSGADAKQHYLDELFVGPALSARLGAVSVKAALWYYYTGYRGLAGATYEHSHNFELVPSVEYRHGRWSFVDRVMLHNTFYASVYEPEQRLGYGLVARNLLQAKYAATENLALLAGIEPFIGVVENGGTAHDARGYWQSGLRLNRIYAGLDWRVTPSIALSPQYVLETAFGPDGRHSETGHYLFVTASYVVKMFE